MTQGCSPFRGLGPRPPPPLPPRDPLQNLSADRPFFFSLARLFFFHEPGGQIFLFGGFFRADHLVGAVPFLFLSCKLFMGKCTPLSSRRPPPPFLVLGTRLLRPHLPFFFPLLRPFLSVHTRTPPEQPPPPSSLRRQSDIRPSVRPSPWKTFFFSLQTPFLTLPINEEKAPFFQNAIYSPRPPSPCLPGLTPFARRLVLRLAFPWNPFPWGKLFSPPVITSLFFPQTQRAPVPS